MRIPRLLWSPLSCICALLIGAPAAPAQCHPPANSHEARLLAFYSVPIAFSADPSAILEPPRSLRLSLEGALVPQPSADLQHTEYCYTGRAENTELTRFFGRPRLSVSLPAGVGIEVSYLPPITVSNATPNLLAAAAWIARPFGSGNTIALRVHATHGTVRGPITCPASSLQQSDANAPCYGTAPSRDQFSPTIFGVELLGISRPLDATGRVRASLGAGVNVLRPHFRVGFSDLLGGTDHTTIDVNLVRGVALAGLDVRASSRCTASAQGYASFTDAATVRAIVGCALLR